MFIIEAPYFNLDQTYLSGQIFRWIRVRAGKYIVPCKDKVIKVEQAKNRLVMSCNEKEFYDYWLDYFDLTTDYGMLNEKLKFCNEYLKLCSVKASGVHIIKQELFETIISFIISDGFSVQKTRAIIDKLCYVCGLMHKQSIRECGRITWYEFPTAENIIEHKEQLMACGIKEKMGAVINICECLLDGWLDLDLLKYMEYEEAKEYLMQFDGINDTVADCICLYSLHHMQAFPKVDVVKKAMEHEFGMENVAEVRDWFFPEFRGYEGIVNQYMQYDGLHKFLEE